MNIGVALEREDEVAGPVLAPLFPQVSLLDTKSCENCYWPEHADSQKMSYLIAAGYGMKVNKSCLL